MSVDASNIDRQCINNKLGEPCIFSHFSAEAFLVPEVLPRDVTSGIIFNMYKWNIHSNTQSIDSDVLPFVINFFVILMLLKIFERLQQIKKIRANVKESAKNHSLQKPYSEQKTHKNCDCVYSLSPSIWTHGLNWQMPGRGRRRPNEPDSTIVFCSWHY